MEPGEHCGPLPQCFFHCGGVVVLSAHLFEEATEQEAYLQEQFSLLASFCFCSPPTCPSSFLLVGSARTCPSTFLPLTALSIPERVPLDTGCSSSCSRTASCFRKYSSCFIAAVCLLCLATLAAAPCLLQLSLSHISPSLASPRPSAQAKHSPRHSDVFDGGHE